MQLEVVTIAGFALASALCFGCTGNECDRAGDHAKQCNITDLHAQEASGTSNTVPDRLICAGTVLCTDACFNQASCDALLANGKDKMGEKSYSDCVAQCH